MSDQSRRFNLQVWLMAGLLAAVIVAGFLVFPKTAEERNALLSKLGTTNHGTFIEPMLDINGLPLSTHDGQDWEHGKQKIKWRLLIADDGSCLAACRDMLYMTRQVHIRTGKNSRRLERIFLLLDNELSEEMRSYLAEEHPYLTLLKGSSTQYAAWLEAANTGWQPGVVRSLVVDQGGRAMMFYTPEHEGIGMLEDLNHLLKYSPTP